MKTEHVIGLIILIIGIALFFVWLFEIPIVGSFFTFLFFIIAVGGMIFGYWYFTGQNPTGKLLQPEMTSFEAFEYLQNEWKKHRNETLKYEDSFVVGRYFGDTLFYGFTVRKGTGTEIGKTISAVVRTHPRDIWWDETPTLETQKNPFLIMSSYLYGSPVKNPPKEYVHVKPIEPQTPQTVVNVGEQKSYERDEIEKFRETGEE